MTLAWWADTDGGLATVTDCNDAGRVMDPLLGQGVVVLYKILGVKGALITVLEIE